MGPLKHIRKVPLVGKILGSRPEEPKTDKVEVPSEESPPRPANEGDPDAHPNELTDEEFAAVDGEEGRSGLTGWVERRAHSVVSKIYDSRADDLETRARRAVSSAYADQADDLEDRAVRAMRRAITTEADRIKEVIEHSVQVKKREVRLSLLVLVTASLVYLALYWFTSRPSS